MSNPASFAGPPWSDYTIQELWRIKCEQEHRLSELTQRVSELSAKLANKTVDTVPLSYEVHQLRKIASVVYRINQKAEKGEAKKIELPPELASILKAMFEVNPAKELDIKPSKQFTIDVGGVTLKVNPIPMPTGSGSMFPHDFNIPDAFTFQEAYARLNDKEKPLRDPLGTGAKRMPMPPEPSQPEPQKSGKNAYEIRLEIMMKAAEMADGDPDKATEIAEKLYRFVEGKRR